MERIKYLLHSRINRGTKEVPDYEDIFYEKSVSHSASGLEIARAEAYNGEYEIYDDGLPEAENASADDVLNALLGVSV